MKPFVITDLLKLNGGDLHLLHPESVAELSPEQTAKQICLKWELEAVWGTLDANGTLSADTQGTTFRAVPPAGKVPPPEVAECDAQSAARICEQHGAKAADPVLYRGVEAVANG